MTTENTNTAAPEFNPMFDESDATKLIYALSSAAAMIANRHLEGAKSEHFRAVYAACDALRTSTNHTPDCEETVQYDSHDVAVDAFSSILLDDDLRKKTEEEEQAAYNELLNDKAEWDRACDAYWASVS